MIRLLAARHHEAHYRSPNFDPEAFFGSIFWDWEFAVFIGREPCAPCNWPERVGLSIPGLDSELLSTLATDIRTRLGFTGSVEPIGPHAIELSSDLAAECLFKLFYIDDYAHESQERLTRLSPNEYLSLVERHLGPATVIESLQNSEVVRRFRREWDWSCKIPRAIALHNATGLLWPLWHAHRYPHSKPDYYRLQRPTRFPAMSPSATTPTTGMIVSTGDVGLYS